MSAVLGLLILGAPLQDGPGESKDQRPEEIEQIRVNTAYTLDAGEIEADLVPLHLEFDDRTEAGATLEIEYGLHDRFMIELEIPRLRIDPDRGPSERGVGDVELEAKVSFPAFPGGGTESALRVEVSFPTGDEERGLGEGGAGAGVFVALSGEFGGWSGHLNLGVEGRRNEEPEWVVEAAVDWRPWAGGVSLLLGVNGGMEGGEGPAWSIVPGFEIRLEEMELQFGLGFPVGLSDEAQNWGIIADVELEF